MLRDVGEFQMVALVVEGDHGVAAVFVAIDAGVVDDGDVEPAIVVAVEEGDASTHHLDEIARGGGGRWGGVKSGAGADVVEVDGGLLGVERGSYQECGKEPSPPVTE